MMFCTFFTISTCTFSEHILPVRFLNIFETMNNLSLNNKINPDSELYPLLDHKLLGLDHREVLGEVHGDVISTLDDQGEGLHDHLPRVLLVHYYSSGTRSSRTLDKRNSKSVKTRRIWIL